MRRIECPNCSTLLDLNQTMKLGHIFICPDCETELNVVNSEPFAIDYYYGEDYDAEFNQDYDEYSECFDEEEFNDFESNSCDYYEKEDD